MSVNYTFMYRYSMKNFNVIKSPIIMGKRVFIHFLLELVGNYIVEGAGHTAFILAFKYYVRIFLVVLTSIPHVSKFQ